MRKAVFAAISFGLCVTVSPVFGQKYPIKPVRLISPFAPGGGTDMLGRVIAQRASETFGQPVVVDNRPGAGGAIGAETTARSEPDGYTFIIVSATYAASSAHRPPPYDPVNDIQAVSLIGTTGLLLTVHPTVPAKTVQELIAYAKANPGKLNFGTVGAGSNVHLAMELFKLMTHTNFVDVPYKGGAPAMTAIVAGEIQVTAMSVVPSLPHVKSGRVRALAVTTAQRSTYLPDIPAVSETVPGYEASHWYGMWGPKGLPRNIIALWNSEVAKALTTEEAKTRMRAEGLEPGGGPPEQFQQIIKRDVEKWRKVIKLAKIRPEA
ncbi:MAG: Bug family tripartite tricarboxylate transporter substrate binding protein [Burkholderiales bacterium]